MATWKPSAAVIKRIVGFTPERSIPTLSRKTTEKLVAEEQRKYQYAESKKSVLLFVDEFTNQHEAALGWMFARLLMQLGYQVEIPRHVESGRAAMSKGCLKRAKKIAYDNVAMLSDQVGEDQPLVGIEPSAILSFRDEYPDLVPSDWRKKAVALGSYSLLYDEFLLKEIQEGHISATDFEDTEMEIWLHGHCHQKALVGIEKTTEVLSQLLKGAKVHVIPSGCCGMAGSFGYEAEHYKTSLQIGEMILFPAIRKAVSNQTETPAIVAAPGFSCRQQILDGTGVKAVHPIEILYRFLSDK